MKASELRHQNLVYTGEIIRFVDPRYIFDLWKNGINLKPVPITKNILLEFGFDYKETDKADNFYINGLRITIPTQGRNKEKVYVNVKNVLSITHIEYMHQLQNFYYALFNQELFEL